MDTNTNSNVETHTNILFIESLTKYQNKLIQHQYKYCVTPINFLSRYVYSLQLSINQRNEIMAEVKKKLKIQDTKRQQLDQGKCEVFKFIYIYIYIYIYIVVYQTYILCTR